MFAQKPHQNGKTGMTFWKSPLCAVALSVLALTGCETTSAVFDGVGGVFIGAGNDVRSIGGR
jgi:hypothetical protein